MSKTRICRQTKRDLILLAVCIVIGIGAAALANTIMPPVWG